jgi:glucokinase
MLLAGDVGGTKTDLAIFSVEGGPHKPLTTFTGR